MAAVWLTAIVEFFYCGCCYRFHLQATEAFFPLWENKWKNWSYLTIFFIYNISRMGKWELILQIYFTVSFSSSNCLQLCLYLPVSLYWSCSLSLLWGGATSVRSIYPLVAQQNSCTKSSALNCCFHWHAHKHASTCLKLYFFKKDHAFISS